MPFRHRHALAALLMCCTAQAQGPDTLIFGTTHERGSAAYNYAVDYLHDVCAEIQQRCQLQSLPGRRGTAMLTDGSIVGELGRVKDYKELHPEYQRVEEPVIILRTYVFTRASRPVVNSWEDVARRVRTVSYRRGVYYYQKRLEALKPAVQPHDVQTVTACLQMVLNGRDQACVFDDGALGPEAQALLPQGRLGKPLDELALHLYLGKDYTVLMPSITDAVKRLNAQGLRARLHKKYFISP